MKKIVLPTVVLLLALISSAFADRLFDSQNNCFPENTQIAMLGGQSIQ
jgi:hypothetical protein